MDDERNLPATTNDLSLPREPAKVVEVAMREGESPQDFVATAIRTAVEPRQRTECKFHARADVAWTEYQRNGVSTPVTEVFAKVYERIELRRQQLGSRASQYSQRVE